MAETSRDDNPAASDRLTCPSCGAPAPADQRFCGQCGASLSQVCPNCQAANPLQNRFCGACGSPLASAPKPRPAAAEGSAEERRWATVLFADISGFTALSELLDAEDVKNLADRCSQRVSQEVRRFGGTVIQVIGDQVYAVFGAPVAHEDDAERAVRAGLALRGLNLSDEAARPIRLHIGINTGDVMAGLIGPQRRRQPPVRGRSGGDGGGGRGFRPGAVAHQDADRRPARQPARRRTPGHSARLDLRQGVLGDGPASPGSPSGRPHGRGLGNAGTEGPAAGAAALAVPGRSRVHLQA